MRQKFVVLLHLACLENFFKLVVSRIAISTLLDEIAPTPNFIEFGLHEQLKVVFQTIFYSEKLTNMCRPEVVLNFKTAHPQATSKWYTNQNAGFVYCFEIVPFFLYRFS
jgi:hypothetical protein